MTRRPLPAIRRPSGSPSTSFVRNLEMDVRDVSSYIDYTVLRADAVAAEVDTLCSVAVEAAFAAVCVNGVWVERASSLLGGTGVVVATVVGFPLGADPVSVKTKQTRDLVERGADEIDMVISLGHLLEGNVAYVTNEIQNVVEAADGRPVKTILETAALNREQIVGGVNAARVAGARFVKTSTGMHASGGATVEAVALLASLVSADMGVKASGGIKSLDAAQRMIAAGATRIGTSTDLSLSWQRKSGRV